MNRPRPENRYRPGFTLIELVTVLGIIGILAAMAVPTMMGRTDTERLKSSTRAVASAFSLARTEAVRSGNIHLVFVGTDAAGNALPNVNGGPALVAVVDDGQPGTTNQNCQIDSGEVVWSRAPEDAVAGGILTGVTQMAEDVGTGNRSTGSTFTEPDGDAASWVLFRPEGTTHAFDAGCTIGGVGTGAGGIYLNNSDEQLGVALRPLGTARVRSWESAASQWRS